MKKCKAICGNGRRCKIEALWGEYCTRHYKRLSPDAKKVKIEVKKIVNWQDIREKNPEMD